MAFEGFLANRIKDYIPPPEPRPKYDPAEEAPMWDWTRLWWNNKLEETAKDFSPVGTQPASPDLPDWRGVVANDIIPIALPEPYKFGQPYQDRYFWFDTPDYADPFKKLGYAFRFFLGTGVFTSCLYGVLAAKKSDTKNILHIFKGFLGPYLAATMAAATTVVTVANLRGKKDDYWNYAAGSLTYATIFGRANYHSFIRSLFVGSMAVVFKHNAEINGSLTTPRHVYRLRSWGITGADCKHGFWSGDLRMGWRSSYGDPGRDTRRMM